MLKVIGISLNYPPNRTLISTGETKINENIMILPERFPQMLIMMEGLLKEKKKDIYVVPGLKKQDEGTEGTCVYR